MATNLDSSKNRTRRRRRRLQMLGATSLAVAIGLAAAGPASAAGQEPQRSPGLLGLDLGLDLSGHGPVLGLDLDLSGLLGSGSGAHVGVDTRQGGAVIDVQADVAHAVQADATLQVGGSGLASVQADANIAGIDATVSANVLSGGSIANVCADVRVGNAQCGADGTILGLALTDVAGLNALGLVDGLTGGGIVSTCVDLTLGKPAACPMAAVPTDPIIDPYVPGDPTDPNYPDPSPSDPGSDPTSDPTTDPSFGAEGGNGAAAASASTGWTGADTARVAALAFTGLGVAGLLAFGLSAIGGGTLLTGLHRASTDDDGLLDGEAIDAPAV